MFALIDEGGSLGCCTDDRSKQVSATNINKHYPYVYGTLVDILETELKVHFSLSFWWTECKLTVIYTRVNRHPVHGYITAIVIAWIICPNDATARSASVSLCLFRTKLHPLKLTRYQMRPATECSEGMNILTCLLSTFDAFWHVEAMNIILLE